MTKKAWLIAVIAALVMTACAGGAPTTVTTAQAIEEENDPSFVPITRALSSMSAWNGIIEPGVPFPIRPYVDNSNNNTDVVIAIQPDNATNRTVIFSVKDAGSTGATFTGDTLNTTGIGTVVITATVPDGLGKGKPFTEDYTIYVAKPPVRKGDFIVREAQGGWFLTNYSGRNANVTIPADLGITLIAKNSLNNNQIITSVVVPEGVTIIEKSAFQRSGNLTSVTLPSTLRIIGPNAFGGCSKLASVTIPSGVTKIEGGAFGQCQSLTSITVQAVRPPLLTDGLWWGRDDTPKNLTGIYVPRASVEAYKKAEGWNWDEYRDLIKPIGG